MLTLITNSRTTWPFKYTVSGEDDTCRERIYCSELDIMTFIILHNISSSAYSEYHWFIVNTWRPCINQLSIFIFLNLFSMCLFHFTKKNPLTKM